MSKITELGGMYARIKGKFRKIVIENNLQEENVRIKANPLSAEEAIGNPERDDFPLLMGKERLMQAEFNGSLGQAFTDMYGDFEGTLQNVLDMELNNNFRRAIFIATLNAVMRHLGLVDGTIHCKNDNPEGCGKDLVEFISETYGRPKIAFIGLQPALAEHCSKRFELKILDMDKENIGKEKFGVMILDGDKDTKNALEWCDLSLVTGTTVVNGTAESILQVVDADRKPVVFYGVTVAGVAKLLNLERFCARST